MSTTDDLKKSLEGNVFFIDRCSGRAISQVFSDAGIRFELHDDHFSQTTLDVEWIAHCGEVGWIVISSNKAIKNNQIELEALLTARIGAFFFTSGDWSTKQKIDSLTKALPKMANLIARERKPFIARIAKDGSIELWINYKGKDVLLAKEKKKTRSKQINQHK